MNERSLEVLKEIYKPYQYTIKGSAHILKSTSGDVVIKKKEQDIAALYNYLQNRGFTSFPKLLDATREGVNVFEYLPDTPIPNEQKAMDFIKLVALLHQKTTYYKEVTEDDFKEIYDNIKEQIEYLKYYYQNIYASYFKSIYPSPSEYLFLRNASKIFASLDFASEELEKWLEQVLPLKKYRLSQIHNHLCLDHFRQNCLLSWEKSRQDSPVMDLINFYKCSWFELNFEVLLKEYLKICPLNAEEIKLFFLVISIPPKISLKGPEFTKVKNTREVLDYVFKTENLIRPYYSVQEEQKS